ncbi:hypothetical protein XELAEV_18006349mg [Xenopus laevis]|nr:hypothetical protein XELAEV_18006349mg [Xenopus laevis]
MLKENHTEDKDVFFLGFHHIRKHKVLLFIVFFLLYTMILAGNLLIIVLVSTSRCLKIPMYFFLIHLSLSDIFLTTDTVPSMLHFLLKEGGNISIAGCITQFYFLGCSGITECLLLAAMSYDRYLAVCFPLHYMSIMDLRCCSHLVICCWTLGIGLMMITTLLVSKLQFCGPMTTDYFFCDFAPLIELSCSDTSIVKTVNFLLAILVTILPFGFIVTTYICILLTVLEISSNTERKKTFSTCSSHISTVCMYYGTLVAIYANPFPGNSLNMKKNISLLYAVVTPFFNPIIYSLKNQEIRTILNVYIRKLSKRNDLCI